MKLFKKIKDERLIIKNLKIVRIVYVIQTLGILGLLAYAWLNGQAAVKTGAIWMVFYLSSMVGIFLSIEISLAHEKEVKSPKRRFYFSLIILAGVSLVIAFFLSRIPELKVINALFYGIVIFIAGLIPSYYMYYLRKKSSEDLED